MLPGEGRDDTGAPAGEPDGSTMRYVRGASGADRDDEAWYPLRSKVLEILEPFFRADTVPAGYELSDLLCGVCARMERALRSSTFEDAMKFRGWLRTLADHEIKDAWRRELAQKRGGGWKRVQASAEGTDPLDGVAADSPSPSTVARVHEIASLERECIERLPARERAIYEMRRRDVAYAEIAATLGEATDDRHLATMRSTQLQSSKRVQECMLRKLDGYDSILGRLLGT